VHGVEIRKRQDWLTCFRIPALTCPPLDHLPCTAIQRPPVGIYQAVYQVSARPGYGLDNGVVAGIIPWIASKRHTGAIPVDHLLNDDSHAAQPRI
jgi:hypothetical protein